MYPEATPSSPSFRLALAVLGLLALTLVGILLMRFASLHSLSAVVGFFLLMAGILALLGLARGLNEYKTRRYKKLYLALAVHGSMVLLLLVLVVMNIFDLFRSFVA